MIMTKRLIEINEIVAAGVGAAGGLQPQIQRLETSVQRVKDEAMLISIGYKSIEIAGERSLVHDGKSTGSRGLQHQN